MVNENQKLCPLLNSLCIQEKCELYMQMSQGVALGTKKSFGMCAFRAVVLITSEMNAKAQSSQSMIQLPVNKG